MSAIDLKEREHLVISYCFDSVDEDTRAALEADPHALNAEMTRLTMSLVAQRETWEEDLRIGKCSPDEYHNWKVRSTRVRSRIQGKAPHVKNLVRLANIASRDIQRGDKFGRIVELIRAHKAAIEENNVEPEDWDEQLWRRAEEIWTER